MSTQKNTKTLFGILLGTLSLFIALTPFTAQTQEGDHWYIGIDASFTKAANGAYIFTLGIDLSL